MLVNMLMQVVPTRRIITPWSAVVVLSAIPLIYLVAIISIVTYRKACAVGRSRWSTVAILGSIGIALGTFAFPMGDLWWIPLAAVTPPCVVGILVARAVAKSPRRFGERRCHKCGYSLCGLTATRCPECGTDSQEREETLNPSPRIEGLK